MLLVMATSPAPGVPGPLSSLLSSWLLALRAEDKATSTLRSYADAVRQFDAYLVPLGLCGPEAVASEHVQRWLVDMAEAGRAPKTVWDRFVVLRLFFRWAAEEGEIDVDPTARIKRKAPPDQPVDFARVDQLQCLLKSLEGRDFVSRRDTAVVRLWADTGVRRTELSSLTVDDVDRETQCVRVHGKGGRDRVVPYGRKTALALDRYVPRFGEPHYAPSWPCVSTSTPPRRTSTPLLGHLPPPKSPNTHNQERSCARRTPTAPRSATTRSSSPSTTVSCW